MHKLSIISKHASLAPKISTSEVSMFDIYALINRYVIYPLYFLKNGDKRLQRLRKLEKQQYLPEKDLEALQLKNLQEIVRYAYEHTRYYRRIMNERGLTGDCIQSLKDIEKLPILTKQIIQEHGDELLSDEYQKSELFKDASGGSTGQPTVYYKDYRRHNIRRADQIRHDGWTGWKLGDRSALIWGAQRDLKSVQSFKEHIISRYIARHWELDAFEMTAAKMDRFVVELERIKPTMILGYASALNTFANYLLKNHPNHKIQLKGIVSSAETLTEERRRVIESAFKCKVLNRYGSREVGLIGSECNHQSGLHINADNLHVEVAAGETKVPVGERGDIVVTDFLNKGMPFIRYRLEDVGYLSTASCNCRRSLPLLGAVEGRTGDFFISHDGAMVHGEYFTHLFYDVPQVKQFQIIQQSLTEIELKIVPNKADQDPKYLLPIKQKIIEMLGDQVNIVVKMEDTIPPTASGKSLFTISKVTPTYR